MESIFRIDLPRCFSVRECLYLITLIMQMFCLVLPLIRASEHQLAMALIDQIALVAVVGAMLTSFAAAMLYILGRAILQRFYNKFRIAALVLTVFTVLEGATTMIIIAQDHHFHGKDWCIATVWMSVLSATIAAIFNFKDPHRNGDA